MKPGEFIKRWTDADLAFMQENSQNMSWAEIGAALGRTKPAVQTKALEVGLRKTKEFITKRSMITQFKPGHVAAPRSRIYANAWKPEDIKYLVDNYEHMTCNEIAVHLNRTPGAVKTTANKVLKLKKSAESKKLIGKRPNAGQFRKGALPLNTLQDLEIRIRTTGGKQSKWIRISCAHWQQLHHYNWIKTGNEIPSGHVLQFIDGDFLNCEPENLKLVKRGPSEGKHQADAEARRRKELIRQEERRLAKAAKERRRLEAESNDRRRLPTRVINFSDMVPVKVDAKTTIYIKAGQDADAAREKYLTRHR